MREIGLIRIVATGLICLSLSGLAQAADFRSVGAEPAILYNAPTDRARKVFVAPRNMPVEVILDTNGWSKVRDVGGDLSWVESARLSKKRTVVVTVDQARIVATPVADGPLAGTANRGVLFEMLGAASSGWVRVQHEDGSGGFINAADVWGD